MKLYLHFSKDAFIHTSHKAVNIFMSNNNSIIVFEQSEVSSTSGGRGIKVSLILVNHP